MRLFDLFAGIEYELLQGDMNSEVLGLSVHSKEAHVNDLFFCVAGTKQNGADYIKEVLAANVSAIVTEQAVKVDDALTVIKVCDIRKVMAQIADAFYNHPSDKLTMIGITGTKGKTTTAYMIYSLLCAASYKVGLIGTVGIVDLYGTHQTTNTTPDAISLHRTLSDMICQGISIVVMEVSSQAFMQKRVFCITFDYGIFTNLSVDHIGKGEHQSFEEYKFFKKRLMQISKCSIINADDLYAGEMIFAAKHFVTYGCFQKATYHATQITKRIINNTFGMSFQFNEDTRIEVGMPGIYSVYNALAAVSVCEELGIGNKLLYENLQQPDVKGRMESIPVSDLFYCYIDYAHNQTALEQLLCSMREYTDNHVILVFGCGGNRSRLRRRLMGEAANKYADMTVLTNDNPRDENPSRIIRDIMQGFTKHTKYLVIEDRKEAIRYALTHAKAGDIVLLAGKGHETYQEIGGKKYRMDERVLIREIMEEENVRTICGYNYRYFDRSNG